MIIPAGYVTEPTRRVLEERQASTFPDAPVFLNAETYAILQAVCARLIPGSNVAPAIDQRLAENAGKGWRYDELPPERDMFQRNLAALGKQFPSLSAPQQDRFLKAVAQNETLFFEELLAMATELHYAQPATQAEIQYIGYADAAGWTEIGLDRYESWEPRER